MTESLSAPSPPVPPKTLSQEVCLAHSHSLGGAGGGERGRLPKQKAETLTQACALTLGPCTKPCGEKGKALLSTPADSFHTHIEMRGCGT